MDDSTRPCCRPARPWFQLALAVIACATSSLSTASAEDLKPIDGEVLDAIRHATVLIHVVDASGAELSGSGCLLGPRGVILTNAHVLGMFDADSRPPQKISVVFDSGETDTRTLPAKLLAVDRPADLAALKVESPQLPKPMRLISSSKLRETQELLVVGFPLGKQLGPNITMSKASVSSLRKEHGLLKEVQLTGGVHPGNSGGPVVDAEGQLVGIAVATVSGTAISFAIPSDHVAVFLMGKLVDYGTDLSVRDGDKIKILYHLNFIDPLGLIKSVRIETFQGPRANSHPLGMKRPDPRPGETEIVSIDVPYDGKPTVTGELLVEPLKDPKFVYWFRPVIVNGTKQEFFAAELSGMTAAPAERKPVVIKFQPLGASSCLELSSDSTFRVRSSGGKEGSQSLLMKLVVDPVYSAANAAGNRRQLALRYAQFNVAIKENDEPVNVAEELQAFHDNFLKTSSVLELEADGTPLGVDVKVDKVDPRYRDLVRTFNLHLLKELDLLLPSLPETEVQPLETFRVRRGITAGMPSVVLAAEADLKYQYQGVHDFIPRQPAAIFTISGSVHPPRGSNSKVGGHVSGRIEVDPKTGIVLQATSEVKVDLDIDVGGRTSRWTGVVKSQLKPPAEDVPLGPRPGGLPAMASDDLRRQWAFNEQGSQKLTGVYRRGPKGVWSQWIKQGKARDFEEWERNPRYVMLVCEKPQTVLRLFDDHCELRTPRGTWVPFYDGVWSQKPFVPEKKPKPAAATTDEAAKKRPAPVSTDKPAAADKALPATDPPADE